MSLVATGFFQESPIPITVDTGATVSIVHLDEKNFNPKSYSCDSRTATGRPLKVLVGLVKWRYTYASVSYTHLDVYKRQVWK